MQNPPAPDASSWFPTWSDAPQSSWVTPPDRVGLPWQPTTQQPTTQDSFFPGVHIMHSPTTEEIYDDALQSSAQMDRPRSSAYMERPTSSEHIDPPRSSVQLDRPSSSAATSRPDKERSRSSFTRTFMDMLPLRRSRRDNRGKGPTKYTPSSFK